MCCPKNLFFFAPFYPKIDRNILRIDIVCRFYVRKTMIGIRRNSSSSCSMIPMMPRSRPIKDFWGVVVECKVMPRVKTFHYRFKTAAAVTEY